MNAARRSTIAAAVLAVALPCAAQAPVTDAGSEAVARALVQAMAANDAAQLRALFAPNASQAYGTGQPKTGAAFTAWLQSDIIDLKGRVDDAAYAANGNEVVITGQYSNRRGYRAAANFLLVVEQGRIVAWRMRY